MTTVTEEKTNYEELGEFDLVQLLKDQSRQIQKLQAEQKNLPLNSAASHVRNAEIDLELDTLKSDRTAVGRRLLQLDQEKQATAQQRSEEAAAQVDELVDKHLEKVAAWVKRAQGMRKVAEDFDALIDEAKKIQSLNNVAAKAGVARPVGGVTPKVHMQRLRKHLISVFGAAPIADINAVRESKGRSYDLAADVEQVIKNIAAVG